MKKAIIVLLVLSLIICFVGCGIFDMELDEKEETKFYLGETMDYDDIEVTVNGLNENKNNDSGNYFLKVAITLKNNKKREFNFKYNDVHIKTEDKGEKYAPTNSSGVVIDSVFSISIIAGGTQEIDIYFITPYSIYEKNFLMYFDWGILSVEQVYHLYPREGKNEPSNDTNDTTIKDETTLNNIVEGIRDSLYLIFKTNCYDNINGNMYYSDISKLMDSVMREIRVQYTEISMHIDYSNGSYFPKWIVQFTGTTKSYSLFYIEVELSTSYRPIKKYMGKYEIN